MGRDLVHELHPLCREDGIGFMVWSPLPGGFLTGKYRRGDADAPKEGRCTEFDFPQVESERGYYVIEVVGEMAEEKGTTIPRLALAWLLNRDGLSSVIVGARTPEQLENDLGATEPRIQYPQWMIRLQTGRKAE